MSLHSRADGTCLFYDVCDTVPPWIDTKETILFVNGLAIDSDIWVTWLPTLADKYRIVRTDLRGFGKSFRPAAGDTWSMAALAQDVMDIMEACDCERIHFVGESTGGTLGLYIAAEHPELLTSLTTVSAAHAGGSIENSKLLRDEVESLGMDAWSEKLMGLRFYPDALPDSMYRWFDTVQRGSTPHCCVDLVDMLVSTDLTAALPTIQTPTLIVAPDNSPFVSVEQQVERLRAMPNARLEVIARSRHGVSHSHGPQCARALRAFLDDLLEGRPT